MSATPDSQPELCDAELDSPELNKTKDESERYTLSMDKTQRLATRNTSKWKPYWQHLINTPRPLASQRVDALTKQQTLQTSKTSKT